SFLSFLIITYLFIVCVNTKKKTKSDLFHKYSESYLENDHIASVLQLLEGPPNSANWLKNVSEKERLRMLHWIRFCILGTDMGAYHASIKQELKNKFHLLTDKRHEWSEEDKLTMARSCLHFADIGNPCREYKVASEWGKLVVTEFYEQGDAMRDLGLEITPGCDRFENSDDQNTSAKPKFDFNTMCFEPLLHLIIPFVPQLKTEALVIYNTNKKLRSPKM
ncbi:PhosphoDiEsterase family member (pde-4), partial [Reticulomyxa filosa]